MIDISKLNKAEVLAALYNSSRQQGMGLLNPEGRQQMNKEQAADLLGKITYFDYLQGRVMKVDLKGDSFNEGLYDRDNGSGAARAAISHLLPEETKIPS